MPQSVPFTDRSTVPRADCRRAVLVLVVRLRVVGGWLVSAGVVALAMVLFLRGRHAGYHGDSSSGVVMVVAFNWRRTAAAAVPCVAITAQVPL
jgi:hypothetical protein